jgi:arylsulfatase A
MKIRGASRVGAGLSGILLLARLACPAFAGDQLSAPPPNFLFILCDDLGYGDLGCFGSAVIKTPNLDRLAAEGLKLTACYAGAPVCSPSRAAIMTGRSPYRAGIKDWIAPDTGIFLKRGEVTVASLLRRGVYRTGHVGKWHLASKMDGSEPTPGDHGFDDWFSTQNNAAPSHENPANFVRNGKPVGPLEGNSSTLIVDEAVGFLKENRDRPFALFVWFHAPHEPVATPEKYTSLYPSETDPTKRTYFGSVSLVDHEVGRLLATLDDVGLREQTLVQFTSDNGPETLNRYRGSERSHGSAGRFRGMKLHMYEGGYRVPGIVRWPGKVKPGTVSDTPVCGVDVLPTLCAAAGIAPPAELVLDGTNLLPLFEGRPFTRTNPLYWRFDNAIGGPWKVAVRDGPWKLLADRALKSFALYNLEVDPGETNDLAASDPARTQAMARMLIELDRAINDPSAKANR